MGEVPADDEKAQLYITAWFNEQALAIYEAEQKKAVVSHEPH